MFAPRNTATALPDESIPDPSPPTQSDVNHFSCKLNWKKEEDKKIKYIIEELTQDGSTPQVYAGYGDEYKIEDLESLRY